MKTYTGLIFKPKHDRQVLIGGTNTQGHHGMGVALIGLKYWGAKYGQAMGIQGQFWGIVTKDLTKNKHPSISKDHIIMQIEVLYSYARHKTRHDFIVPYNTSGRNLNGYTSQDMADMFKAAGPIPENFEFEESFSKLL